MPKTPTSFNWTSVESRQRGTKASAEQRLAKLIVNEAMNIQKKIPEQIQEEIEFAKNVKGLEEENEQT